MCTVKKYSFVALCLAALAVAFTPFNKPVQAETLQEAIQQALDTNPQIRAVHYNRKAREQEVEQARAGYYPRVDLTGSYGYDDVTAPRELEGTSNPREARFSVRQNLYNGYVTGNEVKRQEERVKSAMYRFGSTTESIALDVAEAYLNVLRHQDLHGLSKENLLIHERIFDQIRLRSESGVDDKANLDHITGRLSLALTNTTVTEINIIDARSTYQAVVGTFPQDISRPQDLEAVLPNTLDDAQQTAIDNHPVLKSAQADLDARIAQYSVAKGAFAPTVDVEIDKIWNEEVDESYSGWKNELLAGIKLRYNLYNGGKDEARAVETLHQICEARAIRDTSYRQVIESIRLSWMSYQNAQKKIKLLEEYVRSTEATSEAFTKQWNIGKRTLLDVLDTRAEYINAKKDLTNAVYDRLFAEYRVLSGMGKLVESLGLKMPYTGGSVVNESEALRDSKPVAVKDNG